MADFKIYGRIADIYSPRQGETNGKPWQLQDLVIEEQQNEYTNRVLITLNNYRTNQDECDLIGKSLQDGVMVTASCSVSSREWQRDGKSGYSTNVQVWKVEEGDTRSSLGKLNYYHTDDVDRFLAEHNEWQEVKVK